MVVNINKWYCNRRFSRYRSNCKKNVIKILILRLVFLGGKYLVFRNRNLIVGKNKVGLVYRVRRINSKMKFICD